MKCKFSNEWSASHSAEYADLKWNSAKGVHSSFSLPMLKCCKITQFLGASLDWTHLVISGPDWRLSRRMSGTWQWPLEALMSGGREQFLRSLCSRSSRCRSFLTPYPCEAPLQLWWRIFLAESSSAPLPRPRSEDSNGPNIAGMTNS